MPIGPRSRRQPLARMVVAVDEATGMVTPPATVNSGEDEKKLFRPADMLETIARMLLAAPLRFFPKRLASPSPFLGLLLERLAALHGGGAAYDAEAPCNGLLEFHDSFMRRFY